MKDAKDSLESNPIEVLTKPSEKCPYHKCDGTGWIWIKDWSRQNKKDEIDEDGNLKRAEWMEKCECHEQRLKQSEIDKKLDLAGIPMIFKDATVNSFDVNLYKDNESIETASIAKKAAGNFVANYETLKNNGKGLYLFSTTKGSGKTRLVSSIANALMKVHSVDLAFIKANDLLTQIKKTFGDNTTSESEIIKSLREVEVLVIDDLAVEKKSEFAERVFYDITDYRLEHKKVTLFTSNKTIDNLDQIYKEGRVKSRVKKMCLEIYMPEESIRDEEAEAENEEFERLLFE
ncbi:ATP-binding protein [Psychrobacillus sp. NPDC093200]|uniref:ATP-binding protein n=1 Tax=Psychrobacillus sp. NPDC093200 TaxID=3390656 RepID=UPI003CFCF04B